MGTFKKERNKQKNTAQKLTEVFIYSGKDAEKMPLARQRKFITAMSSCTSPHGSRCCLVFQNYCAMVNNLFSQYCLSWMAIILILHLIKWPKYRIYWQTLVSTHEYHNSGSKLLNIQIANYLKKKQAFVILD